MTHRALFLSLLAGGGTIEHPLIGEDTLASVRAIEAFGAEVDRSSSTIEVTADSITPARIDVANAGTALRIATAVAALADGTSHLAGDASINRRPMGPLVTALTHLGADAVCLGAGDTPPVRVTGPAEGGHTPVDASVSSQFITALCLIGPRLADGLDLRYDTEIVSGPYVDVTIDVLRSVGVEVATRDDGLSIAPQRMDPVSIDVPGDYSSAAFPLVAGAITGGTVTVEGLPEDTSQGDAAIVDHLRAFGVPVERGDAWVRVDGRPSGPAKIDLGDTPDLFPPLTALAATIEGTTELVGAPHLRAKESDRIEAMVTGLSSIGIDAHGRDDGATIRGGTPTGGRVRSFGDHRIQMAFAVLGLAAADQVVIDGRPSVHAVSYPNFLDALRSLGADLRVDEGMLETGGGR